MENIINYYYKINALEISKYNDSYIIVDKENNYYLLYNIKNASVNIDLINNIKDNNYYKIIYYDNKYIIEIENNNYILLLTKGILKDDININDIIINNNKNKYYNKINNDIINLWSKKIDYLEYQISELAINHSDILDSFSFFSGLSENAISFIEINKINFNNLSVSLCHKRYKSLYNIDYYNPINILIDYEVRDYAEYIKYKIINNMDIDKDINTILNNNNLTDDDIKLFYARLMFTTNYFDKIEDILLSDSINNDINIFINNIDNYLNILIDIYYEIQKKVSIIIPDWILRNQLK